MATFPEYDDIPYVTPVKITPRFKTVISSLSGGEEKRRSKTTYPLYDIEVNYDLLETADARELWQFYKSRQGSYEDFYFILPYDDTYVDEYCGVGDGSTTDFDIPGKDISAYTVKVAGASREETTDYVIDPGGASHGGAQIEFVAAPGLGSYVTINFTGAYVFKVRFADDSLPFEVFYQKLTKMGISLVGVR